MEEQNQTQTAGNAVPKQSFNDTLKQLEALLEEYLGKKAPPIPANFKKAIVDFAPYLIIIEMIASVSGLLTLLGLGSYFSRAYFLPVSLAPTYVVGGIFLLGSLILSGMALPGLFAKKKKGWQFVYYSILLSLVYILLTGSIISLFISAAISFYLLFQVKESYS